MTQTLKTFARVLQLLVLVSALFDARLAAQEIPKELQPPANEHAILQVHGDGNQIYACKADGSKFSWSLKEPEAQLAAPDGKAFGKHFAGPTWQASDGSQITGKAVAMASAPSSDAIPWLLLTVTSRSGDGALSRVTSIQRIRTRGGKSPDSGCAAASAGAEVRVPYSADYIFFAP